MRVSQYHIDAVDPTVRNSSQALELELVGPNCRVLDVGCATGFLGTALAAQGCKVTGIEVEPQAAAEARADLDEGVGAELRSKERREGTGGRWRGGGRRKG